MSTKTVIKSVALFFRAGTSDKEYNVFLESQNDKYVVNFTYGRRGNANGSGTKTPVPVALAEAEKVFDKLVAKQLAQGYVANGDGVPFSGIDTAGKMTGLIPMLLVPITIDAVEQYINDDDWMMQEKLDGKRIMVRVADCQVTASNRRGLAVGIPSEIERELQQMGNCVLDGELIGAQYWVFDFLEAQSIDLRGYSCLNRFWKLETILKEHSFRCIQLVRSAENTVDKQELFAAMQHKEGVVLKRKDSAYVPGRLPCAYTQLKCKFWSSASCVVSAVNTKRSIAVSVRAGKEFIPVGNVTVPPNYDLPTVLDIVEVKYLYFNPGGSLYQPQYLGVRDDVGPDTLAQLKPKAEDADEE